MDDVKMKAITKLNELLGSDFKNLSKCQELKTQLQEEKSEIEKMLSLASSEAPSKMTTAIGEVDETNTHVIRISDELKKLNISIDKQQDKLKDLTNVVTGKIDEIDQMGKVSAYLKCIYRIQTLSSNLDHAMTERDDSKTVAEFVNLCQLCHHLHDTQCAHLASFLKETLHYWHNVLKDKFSIQFDEILKSVRWPLLGDNNLLVTPTSETMAKFQLLVKYLINIQLPSQLTHTPAVLSSLLVDSSPLPLPIALLLKPLRKRFIYHFCGKKQTNRADKPEWFLTQVLTWIRDHEQFVEQWVQPVFDDTGLINISAKVELMRGLVELVMEKLHTDLPQLQFDDALFSHTVDEALGFDRELRNCFDYPRNLPGTINVITQAHIFVKWIHMERKYARDKMDAMFSSDTAWVSGDADELKVTQVGEAFMLLLSSMTDRYSMLLQPGHRLQFLELQLELIDDVRVRLLQLLHSERQEPLESRLPAILNTTSYFVMTLSDWGNNTHFLLLQHYKTQLAAVSGDGGSPTQQSSVFDDALDLLQRLVDELLKTLCDAVLWEVKARSRPYRHDKWFAMTVDKESMAVLPSACPMFQILVTKLHNLQGLLATPLFNKAWQTVASQLSNFLLEEVILQNRFNEGGALQLQQDITRNLIPIFRQYTLKPDSYFISLKEACTLLTMPPLPQDWEIGDSLPVEVHHLNKQQVHDVIHRRIDMSLDLM